MGMETTFGRPLAIEMQLLTASERGVSLRMWNEPGCYFVAQLSSLFLKDKISKMLLAKNKHIKMDV